jgi:hypothetical protein
VLGQSHPALEKAAIKTVAFNYAAVSSILDLDFFSKFDVLVTGAILSNDQLRPLRSGNARLVVYQWSSAQYPNESRPAERVWENTLRSNAKTWLLSPDPVGGGAATLGRGALWYDFANPDLISRFSEHIRTLIEHNGYRGVFLDTLGFHSVPETLQREFQKRHPAADYDQCQGEFLSKLRNALGPEAIIFTNQAYRRPEYFLPHADFDLIENSATFIKNDGSTGFRPWFRKGAEWDSIEVPMTNMVVPAGRLYPHTQFVHINYVQGSKSTCDRAVSYSFACAKLWNQLSFVAPPAVQSAIPDNIYFRNLGEPFSSSYEEDREGGVAWRRFTSGVVAINSSMKQYRISSLKLTLSDPPRGYVFPIS